MSIAKHDPGQAGVLPPDDCRDVFERLSEFLDGDLSPQDCARIQEHIKDCEPCVAFLESLKTSIRAAHELRPQEPVHNLPEGAREKLQAAWKAALQRRVS